MSVSAVHAAEAADTGSSFATPEEARFMRRLQPALEDVGVTVRDVRHLPGTGELHVDLYLPSENRALREKVLCMIQDFEAAYAHTLTVSAALLHAQPEEN